MEGEGVGRRLEDIEGSELWLDKCKKVGMQCVEKMHGVLMLGGDVGGVGQASS